jgi:hypothetical protein
MACSSFVVLPSMVSSSTQVNYFSSQPPKKARETLNPSKTTSMIYLSHHIFSSLVRFLQIALQ